MRSSRCLGFTCRCVYHNLLDNRCNDFVLLGYIFLLRLVQFCRHLGRGHSIVAVGYQLWCLLFLLMRWLLLLLRLTNNSPDLRLLLLLFLGHIRVNRYALFREASGFRRCWTLSLPCLLVYIVRGDSCIHCGSWGDYSGCWGDEGSFRRSLCVLIAWYHYFDRFGTCGRDWAGRGGDLSSWTILELSMLLMLEYCRPIRRLCLLLYRILLLLCGCRGLGQNLLSCLHGRTKLLCLLYCCWSCIIVVNICSCTCWVSHNQTWLLLRVCATTFLHLKPLGSFLRTHKHHVRLLLLLCCLLRLYRRW